VIFIFIVFVIVEYTTDYTIGIFAMRVEVQQRLLILDKLVDQDIDFFLENASGKILTRLVADTQSLSLGIQQFLTNIIYAVAGVLTAIIVLFLRNVPLTAIAVGYTVLVLMIGFVLFVFFRRSLLRMFDFKREIDAEMTDRIINISLIKSSGQELQEIGRIEKNNAIYNK
jgi:ATP-binding cassette subfamily B protein